MAKISRVLGLVSSCAGLIATAGCTFDGVNSIPLPGNAVAGSGYTVTVELADAQNLVGNSPVKANNVTVGNIQRIENDGWHAKLTLAIVDDVVLPGNIGAKLSQTSVLGSQYIELSVPPTEKPTGRLAHGAVIPLARTGQYASVEEVLSALSLVLNGAGLQQVRTITGELDDAVGGREESIHSLIGNLNRFVGGLDAQRDDITRAIDSMDRLGAELAQQSTVIDRGITSIQPALDVLRGQEGKLTQMLAAVGQFGDKATGILHDSKIDLQANLANLAPTLQQLAAAGNDLPEALKIALTIPFPVTTADRGIRGDYLNLFLTLDISPQTIANKVIPSIPHNFGGLTARQAVDPLIAPAAPGNPANPDNGGPR
ncbi:MAG: mce4E [Nocardia sp.]|uniref:MCE family protein n=1 Tax=Nocardia sp. TaxID=1821 RepID=UPI00262B4C2E|nr:MCE family protein [Nocardia sp.]MCU1643020.1 mce4E [Nocardia sp.]